MSKYVKVLLSKVDENSIAEVPENAQVVGVVFLMDGKSGLPEYDVAFILPITVPEAHVGVEEEPGAGEDEAKKRGDEKPIEGAAKKDPSNGK